MIKTRKSRFEAPAVGETNGAERVWSSNDVARIAAVSLRQLQWWDEQKVVCPRHEGHRREYAAKEVVEIAVIAELRRKGFSLQKIRRVLKFLQKEMGKRVADLFAAGSEMHLLTDGKNLFLEESGQRVIDVLKNAKQPMFLVCVSDQVQRVTTSNRKPVKAETGVASRKRAAL
jgi:DNA-binding transcriptional MerR regulator